MNVSQETSLNIFFCSRSPGIFRSLDLSHLPGLQSIILHLAALLFLYLRKHLVLDLVAVAVFATWLSTVPAGPAAPRACNTNKQALSFTLNNKLKLFVSTDCLRAKG